MNKNVADARELNSDEKAARVARRKNIIAFVVCLFVAFLLWLVIMNVDSTADTPAGDDGGLPSNLLEMPGGNS